MFRALRYFIIIGLLAVAAVWLAEQPGAVSLQWAGYQIDTSFGVMAVGLGVLVIVSGLLYRLWLFICRAPGRARSSWLGFRRGRGYQALTKGMVAVAAGDAEEARRQARKADNLLSEPPLTMLLSAQAAQLSGDERAAERFFRAMTENRETEFLGLRGLLNQAMQRRDTDEAVALARRAHALRPDSEWVSQSLFELQTRSQKWLDAGVTVKEAARNRHLSNPDSRHRQAVLACQMGVEAMAKGDHGEATKQAKAALDLDGYFLPAALILAHQHMTAGKKRKARALIERFWSRQPHPVLAELYALGPDVGKPLERVKAAEHLSGFNPDHIESHLAVAHAALDADLWGQARKHLEQAGVDEPSARVCRMMADLEEAEHGDMRLARQWLVRSSRGGPDPAWVCGSCGHTVESWNATCAGCHGFDTFTWRMPPHVMHLDGPADDDAGEGTGKISDKELGLSVIEHDHSGGKAGGGAENGTGDGPGVNIKPPVLTKPPLPAEG